MKNWITPIAFICILAQISVSITALHGAETLPENNNLLLVDEGCTDPTACNYEMFATIDDGSCYYGTSTCPGDFCSNDTSCIAPNSREVDAKITATTSGCADNFYCINIEVRGQGGADYLGGASIRFNYDPSVVYFSGYTDYSNGDSNPIVIQNAGFYTSLNFDNDQSTVSSGCNIYGATPYSEHSFDGQIPSDFLITIFLDLETIVTPEGTEIIFACPSIEDTWTVVNEICFEVIDPNGNPNFQFAGIQNSPVNQTTTGGTNFNDDSNEPEGKYRNGTLSGLTTPFSEVCNEDMNACQLTIPMPYAGWHLISSYCKPLNDSIEAVFRPIVSDIIQVKNLTGQVYIPSFNNFNNGLDFWDINAGYLVKTFDSVDLGIVGGQKVDLNVDNIPLYTGWNLVAYWLQGDTDPIDVFDNISTDVIQVKNLSGVYVPSFNNFNNMGNMAATRGYLVKMNTANTLTYNAADILPKPVPGSISDTERLTPIHFTKKIKPNPNTSTMIVLNDESNNLSFGDELGIFTKDGLLVGAFVYENDLMGGLIFGDDETEEGVDGILENENYVFKIWDKLLNTERSVEMEIVQGNSSYKKDDLCVVGFKTYNITGINAIDVLSISVTPHPASSQITFDINLSKTENFTIEIYNVSGKLVELVFNGKLTIGSSKIDCNVDHLSSGLYYCKISNSQKYFTERLIITH